MRPVLSDTHPEIERMQIESLRRLSESDRLRMAFQLSEQVWTMARQAFADRYPDSSPEEQLMHFIAAQYGDEAASRWHRFARQGQK